MGKDGRKRSVGEALGRKSEPGGQGREGEI